MTAKITAPISKAEMRQFRAIAHHLSPVVTIGNQGLSQSVVTELERALNDHELIKIRIVAGDRGTRDSILASLCSETGATVIQQIGHTATILRRTPQPDPRKSNLLR